MSTNILISKENGVPYIDTKVLMDERPSVCEIFACLFNLNAMEVIVVFEDENLPTSSFQFTGDYLGVKEFAKYLTALIDSGLLDVRYIPKAIKWRTQYSGGTTKDVVTEFTHGSRLSELGYDNVLAVSEFLVIASDYTGAVHVDTTPVRVMLLNDTLALDKAVNFVYCSPEHYNLNNINWNQTVKVHDTVFECYGTVTIKAECPIDAVGDILIRGDGNSVLILENVSKSQPCIGAKTNDNLSYGRWEIPSATCKSIAIRGVKVICKSPNASFMLGEYGTDRVPEIYCEDGGSIEAAEMNGKRIMVKGLEPLYGSTKHSDFPEYKIVDNVSTSDEDLVTRVLREEHSITDADTIEKVRKALPEIYLSDYESCSTGISYCLPSILKYCK